MKLFPSSVVKAVCVSFALTAAGSVTATMLSTEIAYAKNNKNNGNGHGNGHGNGNGNGNAKSANFANFDGVSPSELGALNAAHASPNALLHASPNSRVGRIAIFRDAVLETGVLQDERDAAQALLDGLTVPDRTSDEVVADLDLAAIALADANALVADLGDDDPIDQAAYDQAVSDRDAIADEIVVLGDELDDTLAHEDAASDVADLDLLLADRPAIERSLLEAAANKEVTDAIEAAVENMLGLN